MPHSHDHGGCDHEATDIDNALEMGIQYSLFEKIDMLNLECLNEEQANTGQLVFKPYEQRLNFERFVQSDSDAELLFNIPFTGHIKLKGLIIIGPDDSSHPSRVKLFKNRPKMTFDDAQAKADQEFSLHPDPGGRIEYATKVVQFTGVHHLSLCFPANFGAETTRIYYIGLRGEFTKAHYHGVTICNYESRANAADHKGEAFDQVHQHIQ